MPPASPRRYLGRTVGQQSERIADWIMDEWSAHRNLGYVEMRSRAMQEFEVGQRTAESALIVVMARFRDREDIPVLRSRVLDAYWDLHDAMKAKGDERGARSVLDSITTMMGIGVPAEVHISGGLYHDVKNMSEQELDDQINSSNERVARALARKREKELRGDPESQN